MNRKPLSDEPELILRASAGDEAAFTRIFNHYYPIMGRFIFKITQSPEFTEEIVQDAFVRIWIRKEKMVEIEHFENYLYITCRNQAFTTLKRNAAQKLAKLKIEEELLKEIETDAMDNPAEVYREMIAQSVSRLPEQQRKVYMMSRYDRKKYAEIAKELGLSEVTIKKHIQLAVKFIHQDISGKMGLPILLILSTTLLLK